jgi:hypothetical protein
MRGILSAVRGWWRFVVWCVRLSPAARGDKGALVHSPSGKVLTMFWQAVGPVAKVAADAGRRATMEAAARVPVWMRHVVIGVFVAAILGGILLPVYTDEIGWRLQARAGFDGVDKMFSDLCGPNTVARPPFWMMPVRWYSALFNGLFPSPLYVRISGILYALAWSGMLLAVVRRVAGDRMSGVSLATIAFGFLSLGTMPLLLVWSRPEQPIMLAFTGAIMVALAGRGDVPSGASTAAAWGRSLVILALGLAALSYHVKAVVTVPLFLVCIALAAGGKRTVVPRAVAAAILAGAAVWAAHYWIDRLACPGDPTVRASILRNTGAAVAGATSGSQLLPLLGSALDNVSVLLFPGLPAPRAEPMSDWLPAGRITVEASFAWFLAMVAIWSAAFMASALRLAQAAVRGWRERRIDGRAVIAAALFATVLGWSASGFVSVYEANFTVPMLVIGVVLALSTRETPEAGAGSRPMTIAAAALGVLGIASVATVSAMYGPSLVAATQERGYIEGQPLSISSFGYSGVERDVLGAARLCGIGDPGGRRRLLIDDVSYFPFMRSYMPDHQFGLFAPMVTTKDKVGYLRRTGSDGIVASCSVLPPELRGRARRSGQFCCLAPPNW